MRAVWNHNRRLANPVALSHVLGEGNTAGKPTRTLGSGCTGPVEPAFKGLGVQLTDEISDRTTRWLLSDLVLSWASRISSAGRDAEWPVRIRRTLSCAHRNRALIIWIRVGGRVGSHVRRRHLQLFVKALERLRKTG